MSSEEAGKQAEGLEGRRQKWQWQEGEQVRAGRQVGLAKLSLCFALRSKGRLWNVLSTAGQWSNLIKFWKVYPGC